MARIYWHSVEFGLSREDGAVKIFGAGLASSFGEFGKALDGDDVERRSSRSRRPPRRLTRTTICNRSTSSTMA